MSRDELRPGQRIGEFVVQSTLGRGGMGIVYAARDERLKRLVALKVISPNLAADPQYRDRFISEARAAAAIEHKNIVPIYEVGNDEDVLFIAMRLIDGQDLASFKQQHPELSIEAAINLLTPIAEALDFSAARGLVHRDVKPQNILVETLDDGGTHAYLTDFGVAKAQGAATMTATGQFVGSIDYVAPEQIIGKDLTGYSDQYSLGCVIYEFLTGRPPFVRDQAIQSLFAHVNEEPVAPSAITPGISAATDTAVLKALSKEPTDRFESNRALMDALRVAIPGPLTPTSSNSAPKTVIAAKIGDANPTVKPRPTVADANTPATRTAALSKKQPPDKARSKRYLLVAGVGVLAIVIVGIALATRSSSPTPPTEAVGVLPPECDTAIDTISTAKQELAFVGTGLADAPSETVKASVDTAAARVNEARLALGACTETTVLSLEGSERAKDTLFGVTSDLRDFRETTPRFKTVPLPLDSEGLWVYPDPTDWNEAADDAYPEGAIWDEINDGDTPCSEFRSVGTRYWNEEKGLRNPPGWRSYEAWCKAARGESDQPTSLIKEIPRPDRWFGGPGSTRAAQILDELLGDEYFLKRPE
jgi:serine/threonine protein kinase